MSYSGDNHVFYCLPKSDSDLQGQLDEAMRIIRAFQERAPAVAMSMGLLAYENGAPITDQNKIEEILSESRRMMLSQA